MKEARGQPHSTSEKNKRLLQEKRIKPWQYCLRENITTQELGKDAAQTNKEQTPEGAPQWAGGKDKKPSQYQELTWKILEEIEQGAQTGCLLPYEASILFEIQGEKIQTFLKELKLPNPPNPSWVPEWAKTTKLHKERPLHGVNQYLASLPEYQDMSAEEEIELIKASRSKNQIVAAQAEEKLLVANLRLVVSIARKNNYNTPLEDLISEGNLGLRTAIQKYKPGMGARLSTYAAWWIKQSIRKALNDSKTIRVPLHQQQNLKKIQDATLRLTEITGANPSDEEIAEETGIKAHTINRLRNLTTPMLSLQHIPNNESEGKTYEETLKDNTPNGASPLEKLSQKHALETLEKILTTRLNPQEQEVIRLRFGFGTEPPKTLDETGEVLALTRERIRQIQDKALKKLKDSLEAHQKMQPTLAYAPFAPCETP